MLPEKFFPALSVHFDRREDVTVAWSDPIARLEGLVDFPDGQIAIAGLLAVREGDPTHPYVEIATARTDVDDAFYLKWDNLRTNPDSALYVASAGFLVTQKARILKPVSGEMTTQLFLSLTDPNTPSTLADVPFQPTVTMAPRP